MQENNNWSPVDDSSSSAALATRELILYSFWQSSCSWRVRFALNLKGLLYEYRAVNLAKGEQFSPEFEKLNPLHYVPVLADGDILVSDSLAILLYLEEKYPQNALLPVDPYLRAINLQAANIVASSIQPLHMMTFLNYIEEKFGSEERLSLAQSTIEKGFFALEKLLNNYAGKYAMGDNLYLADVFLAPQIAIATKRFNIAMVKSFPIPAEKKGKYFVPLECINVYTFIISCSNNYRLLCNATKFNFPTLSKIFNSYLELPEFIASLPERQPDAIQ